MSIPKDPIKYQEWRRKIIEAKKDYKHSIETKRKIGEKTKLNWQNPEFRKKNHGSKGKHWKISEEIRKKIGEASKKQWQNPEFRKQMSEIKKALGIKPPSSKGRKLTDKTKEKISKGNKGKHRSEEIRKKLSEIQKGQHHSSKTEFKKGMMTWNKGKPYLQIKGEKNPNWKGGITPKNERIRESLEFKLWRKAVFERDNFTCQKCGEKGGRLVAHHIFNFADYPELRFAIDNGITLCNKCHREFHKKYGKINNTKEQLEEFLKIS